MNVVGENINADQLSFGTNVIYVNLVLKAVKHVYQKALVLWMAQRFNRT